MRPSKVTDLEQAASIIEDGMFVAVGGLMLYNKPMALIREIIRKGVKDLTLLAAAPSTIDVDHLIGSGGVREVIFQSLTVERVGPVAPRFRFMTQAGDLTVVDCDQGMINAGLRAAKYGLPSLPTVAGLGSEMVDVSPQWFKPGKDPFVGSPVVNVKAMRPDVALVHCSMCDPEGHAQHLGGTINDSLLSHAAERVIVTTERVVPTQVIEQEVYRTFTWAHKVAAVVEVPYGAHPLGVHGHYPWDGEHLKEYAGEARSEEGFERYAKRYIYDSSHPAYLESIGWERLMSLPARAGRFAASE